MLQHGFSRWAATFTFGLFTLAGLESISTLARADPVSDEACLRASTVKEPGVSVLQKVIDLADHHCFANSKVDGRTPLRPQAQWASQRSGSPCRVLTLPYAAPGTPGEQKEAECVASWVEYRRYMAAHEQCSERVSDVVRQRAGDGKLDRPDLRKICPDPNFGSP